MRREAWGKVEDEMQAARYNEYDDVLIMFTSNAKEECAYGAKVKLCNYEGCTNQANEEKKCAEGMKQQLSDQPYETTAPTHCTLHIKISSPTCVGTSRKEVFCKTAQLNSKSSAHNSQSALLSQT